MRIKSFIASTVQEALAGVRREMGDTSIILETRNIEEGDIKSRSGQTLVEIVAAENIVTQEEDEAQSTDQDTDSNVENELTGEKINLKSELPSVQTLDTVPADQNLPVENLHALDQIDSDTGKVTLADCLQPDDIIEIAESRVSANPVDNIDKMDSPFNKHWPEESKELYKQLRDQQVEKEHSRALINEALRGLHDDDYKRDDLHRMMVRKCIIKRVKNHSTNTQDTCKTMVFMGPAGTGKTTTILKLATDLRKRLNRDILFVSIRGNSVEMLKKTADLIGATLRTVTTQREIREVIDKHGTSSHIFIDTPALSIFDDSTLMRLKGYLDGIKNLETHLVLSATTRYVDIINMVKRVDAIPVHRLLFTKIDETNLYGTLVSVAMETQIPVSYITDGYDVPEDINPITAEMVAEMVL